RPFAAAGTRRRPVRARAHWRRRRLQRRHPPPWRATPRRRTALNRDAVVLSPPPVGDRTARDRGSGQARAVDRGGGNLSLLFGLNHKLRVHLPLTARIDREAASDLEAAGRIRAELKH